MQQRRLIRARGLSAFRRVLVDLACEGHPLDARRRVILVPTRAAGELLRQTIEARLSADGRRARVLPEFVTRDQWLARLHQALPSGRPLLGRPAREVLLGRAARLTAARPRMRGAPFQLRVGLVASMLDFYDELGRRQRRIRRFAQALFEQLRVERGTDRGSEGLIHQTAFLGFTFLAYQRLVEEAGGLDEHSLRRALVRSQPALPFDHLVLAVADHPSDPRGLWPADFDLVGRLTTLGRLDVVMTDETHDAGFRERLEQELPGIEEVRAADDPRMPVLITPDAAPADPVFVSRDREEEVRDVTRAIRRRAAGSGHVLAESVAVVFHRPLPYLYLGQQVLTDGQVPYQAFDALPLGAEPYAALLDQMLVFARTGGTREAAISLLRSPLVRFDIGGAVVDRRDATALDGVLRERRVTGEASSYVAEVDAFFDGRPSRHGVSAAQARRAAESCVAIQQELLPFREASCASGQVACLGAFLRHHEGDARPDAHTDERGRRARAAVLAVLDELADAFRRHDDRYRDEGELTAAIHHVVEARTFTPARGHGGVHLVDAVAARFGDVDHVHVVGLVETDWPERVRRSIFYTGSLLASLGWPQELDQLRAQQATFRDLLSLARLSTSLHAFQLEGDAIVALSPLVDVARDASPRLVVDRESAAVFADEVLTRDWIEAPALEAGHAAWLAARRARPDLTAATYSGTVGPQAPQAYRVSRVDRYVDCPFKYFAEAVLALTEERDEGAGLSPLERGTLLHTLFERFYQAWAEREHGTITADVLPEALALFTAITREALAGLPDADRALEETRLLGSIVDRGVAERVFELEVDAGGAIAHRLLEVDLKGTFSFPRREGVLSVVQQPIEIRGKADRIDVFADGALRVIDYKLSRLPDVDRSIQIAVYAHTAKQQLEAADGQAHPVRSAMYLAFGDDRRLEGALGKPGAETEMTIEARAAVFADTIGKIEAGVFRPRRIGLENAPGADTRVSAAKNTSPTLVLTMQPTLFDLKDDDESAPPDQAARDFAVDPANDVVLEASAGTGKTRVLVDRYVRLIERGVDPRHVLAITFTRKAAAEMRERVLATLRRRADEGAFNAKAWRRLRDRIAEIQITTIDAFCFGLLREFPLEADVDPAFEIADETEMARFANEALDLTLRAARGLLRQDEHVRLLFARVKTPVLRQAIGGLLDRRHVAVPAIGTFVGRLHGPTTAAGAAAAFVAVLRSAIGDLARQSGGLVAPRGGATRPDATMLTALTVDGPHDAPEFRWVHADLVALAGPAGPAGDDPFADPARVQQLRRRMHRYFLTLKKEPRQKLSKPFTGEAFASPEARRRHEAAVKALAPAVLDALSTLDGHVTGLLARGLQRVVAIAVDKYERLLSEHSLLDFAGMLDRAVALLERQEEFARSRLKLQARYHHVLVDEFQDTSRLQWRLIELLIDAWGEGEGASDAPTSIFVVGDRKQSIYRFRHAEVTLLDAAARKIGGLRPGRVVRQAISASFRAVPELLAFVNVLASQIQGDADLDERFGYGEKDRFPVVAIADGALRDGHPVLGLVAEPSVDACAHAVAGEVERLLATATVRDRNGPPRPARPDDMAILFRARAGHQYFESALAARGIRSYVYKGLGFFDAPEVQDLQALLRFLAQPDSDLRAAEFLRSRLVRLSDVALVQLAGRFSQVLVDPHADTSGLAWTEIDRRLLARAREAVPRWLGQAGHLPPSELLDLILRESAYVFEMRGRRLDQARENIKKVRALVRRVESRGYATLDRLAAYFETLRAGDESNAILEATGAVNLMTMHAAKGLEFPIVFLVNLHAPGRGRPPGFSVIDRGVDGLPEVAFDATESTRLEERREQEELRRVLYVAVTRARDRVYLVAQVDGGRLKRATRSIGALLPLALTDLFSVAAGADQPDQVSWATDAGRFAFSVCRPPSVPAAEPSGPMTTPADLRAPDVAPVLFARRRVAASDLAPSALDFEDLPSHRSAAEPGDRLVGTLVHRLLAVGLPPGADSLRASDLCQSLVRAEELVDVPDPAALYDRTVAVYRALRGRQDVSDLLASGDCHFEVPFSYAPPDRPGDIIRGVADCVVAHPDGTATLVEFKTGRPRPEHERQATTYAIALAAAFGTAQIGVRIVYA